MVPSRARRARTPRCPVGVVCFHLKSGLEVFGSSDHSKCLFCEFWMILRDQVTLTKVGKHLVRSQYAISSRSNQPNSRKWPKTSIVALWIIQKCIFCDFWMIQHERYHSQMLRNILHYHDMQYQVPLRCQNHENDQNLFSCIINELY